MLKKWHRGTHRVGQKRPMGKNGIGRLEALNRRRQAILVHLQDHTRVATEQHHHTAGPEQFLRIRSEGKDVVHGQTEAALCQVNNDTLHRFAAGKLFFQLQKEIVGIAVAGYRRCNRRRSNFSIEFGQ